MGLSDVGNRKSAFLQAFDTSTPEEVVIVMDAHIHECARPRSRICCFLGQTTVLCSAGLSPLTEDLQALREVAWTLKGALCAHQHQKTRPGGQSLEGEAGSGYMGGKEQGDRSWKLHGRGAGTLLSAGPQTGPQAKSTNTCHCSVGWGDGREGPTEPHVQLSPKELLE